MKSNASHGNHGGRWVRRVVLMLVLVLVAGAAWAIVRERLQRQAREQNLLITVRVERGPLTISFTESGTIQNRDQMVVKSEVEGTTTILWLVEEGKFVQKGDLLVELDSSRLQDALMSQQISLQNAEAAFVRSRENLDVVKNQAQSDISKAELEYQFAQEDLIHYKEGEYPQALREQDSRITIAEEEVARTKEKLNWSTRLFESQYLSRTELDADRIAAKKAELELELARSARDLLTNFTYKRRVTELESNVDQTRMALERVKRKANADIIQAEADLRAKQAQFEQERKQLEKVKDQIAKCTIRAPIEGMVVYATTGRSSYRGTQEPLAEGQQVRERQDLIFLPTANKMKAEIRLHESVLDKVRRGMPALVTVDALPGKVFHGVVDTIALLPDAQMAWMNPDLKVYRTNVNIEGEVAELRAGMTCRVEIVAQQYDDVLYVPLQSVLRVGGQTVAFVPGEKGPQARPVEIGLDNGRWVHIVSGLEAGQEVLLAPPLSAGEALTAQAGLPLAGGVRTAPAEGAQASAAAPAVHAAKAWENEAAPASETPSLQDVLTKLQGLTSREERREYLQSLPEDLRAKVTEQMRSQFRPRTPAAEGNGAREGARRGRPPQVEGE